MRITTENLWQSDRMTRIRYLFFHAILRQTGLNNDEISLIFENLTIDCLCEGIVYVYHVDGTSRFVVKYDPHAKRAELNRDGTVPG